jgi:hypothetical protein
VAGVMLVPCFCRSCRGHASLGKESIGGASSSSLAQAPDDEVASRLLAQPAHRLKPASLAKHQGDSWDISRQMALPLAYPNSHPHDTSPETGKVSWVSMGLWRVLFLAEVDSYLSKSQDVSSGSEAVVL